MPNVITAADIQKVLDQIRDKPRRRLVSLADFHNPGPLSEAFSGEWHFPPDVQEQLAKLAPGRPKYIGGIE